LYFHATNKSEGDYHGVKGPPFYSCGCEVGVCFFKLFLNFGVENGLPIVHFPLGRLTIGFPFFWVWQVGGGQTKEFPSF